MPVDNVLGVEGGAFPGREYKAVIRPLSARPKLFLYLALAMASEGAHDPLRQTYGSAAGVLRLGKFKPAGLTSFAIPAPPLQLAVDPQRASVEVYIRPLERERLALPESGHEAERVEGLVAIPLSGVEERLRLFGVEGLYFLLPNLRLIRVGGGVSGDEVAPHGLFKGCMQHRVNATHRRPGEATPKQISVEVVYMRLA